jgi:hypothetical protein
MGMYCTLRRVNETDLRRLRKEPEQVSRFLYGEPAPLEEVREPGLVGFIMRLFGKTYQVKESTAEEEFANRKLQEIQQHEVDLEKAWHGLHFLFTGTDDGGEEPGCFLLSGGEEIGDEDVGPARVLRPDQVSQFATFLADLSYEELARRYDPARMTALEIYPDVIWMRPEAPGESARDYLFGAFEDLRAFVTETAKTGESVIISIS